MRTNLFKKIATILGLLSLAHVTSIAQTPINVPGFLKFEVYPDILSAVGMVTFMVTVQGFHVKEGTHGSTFLYP